MRKNKSKQRTTGEKPIRQQKSACWCVDTEGLTSNQKNSHAQKAKNQRRGIIKEIKQENVPELKCKSL